MKIRILLSLLAISLQLNLNAQVAHDYKKGCCKLVGTINSIESCYCAGCADTAKKNLEAKNAEDKRIKDLSIKKAEEERQKAIERQKKENERVAQQNRDSKANTLHYGFGSSKNTDSKVEKASINVSGKANEERLNILSTRVQKKYFNNKDFEYSLVDKNSQKILTVKNGFLEELYWGDNGRPLPKETNIDFPNVYILGEYLDIGYSEYAMEKYNLIDNKGQKIFKREDIVSIKYCGKGYFLLVAPSWTSNNTSTSFGKTYHRSSYQYILYDYYKKRDYLLPYWNDDSLLGEGTLPNFSKKLSELNNYTKNKIQSIPNNENIIVAVCIEAQNHDPNKQPFYMAWYYFNSKDLQWKLLYGATTYDEWKSIHR